MKILVACEESQAVTKEFRKLGHEAYSCDILPTSGENPEWHLQQDVTELLKQDWDMIIAFPPCFTEETLILTQRGYIPISEVVVGDEVLTHLGRWRKVYKTMNHPTTRIREIKSSNNILTQTTNEHPFYVRERKWIYKKVNGVYTHLKIFNDAEWKEAKDLTKNYFTGAILPEEKDVDVCEEDLWLMGRYVADGHLRPHRGKSGEFEGMIISVGKHKIDHFKQMIKTTHYSVHESRTAYKCCFSDSNSLKKFEQFGKGAENKTIPTWVLSLPKEKTKVFLDGYMSGDGYHNDKYISACSVSKKLILGVYLLYMRVYCEDGKQTPTIPNQGTRTTSVIEGRTVNTKPIHSLKMSKNVSTTKTYFDADKNIAWCPILKNEEKQKNTTVYNISVEEDESYTANGVIVHNCTHLAVSGARHFAQKQADGRQQRSIDFFMLFANAKCEKICIENPIGIMSSLWRKPDQIVQPWMFGHAESKATCFWLKGLPKLVETNNVKHIFDTLPKNQQQRIHYMPPSKNRGHLRSKTYEGIAKCMAETWGK